MFGTQQNNPNNKPSANTRIATWYCDTSCLQLGFWDNNLSIKLNPTKAIDPDTGKITYDFDNRVNTAIVQEKAAPLLQAIEQRILPIIRGEVAFDGNPIKIGFPVGKEKTMGIFVEYKNDEKGVPSTYLTVYKNIGTDNCTTDILPYKFNKVECLFDYDNEKGTAETEVNEGEFMVFVSALRMLPTILGPSYHANKYYSIMDKSASSQMGQNSGGNYSRQSSNSGYSAPITNYSADSEDYPF